VLATNQQVYRSGLLDSGLRLSVNLKGGPAMPLSEFVKWKQKTVLGASLKVITPTGQYGPTNLINWGINRWAFKPESWLLAALWQVVVGWLRGCMVLHHEPEILFDARTAA
jgi:hypothetical protein